LGIISFSVWGSFLTFGTVKLYGNIPDSFISAIHQKAYKVAKELGEDYNTAVFGDVEGLTAQALRDEVMRC